MAKENGRNVTRNDVAQLAGVSTAVVSYVVNNGPRPVAEATREKVLDAIRKLDYQPNAAARSLITGKADALALIVPDVGNPYFGALALEVEFAARERGKTLILAQAPDNHHEVMAELNGGVVDGIISAVWPDEYVLRELARRPIPMVQMSIMSPQLPFQCLQPDYHGGSYAAVRHLIGHGHQQIALVTGASAAEARGLGWAEALSEAGLPPGPVVEVGWSRQGGYDAAARLLEAHPGVTAAFVTSDNQAIGFLSGLHQAGKRVPEDLAVASFDGSPDGAFTIPPLTSVRVPIRQLARDAVAQVLEPEVEKRGVVYPCDLIVRTSCGC